MTNVVGMPAMAGPAKGGDWSRSTGLTSPTSGPLASSSARSTASVGLVPDATVTFVVTSSELTMARSPVALAENCCTPATPTVAPRWKVGL